VLIQPGQIVRVGARKRFRVLEVVSSSRATLSGVRYEPAEEDTECRRHQFDAQLEVHQCMRPRPEVVGVPPHRLRSLARDGFGLVIRRAPKLGSGGAFGGREVTALKWSCLFFQGLAQVGPYEPQPRLGKTL
jgi:hypothetical protein